MPEEPDRITYSIPQPFDVVRREIDDTFLIINESEISREDRRIPFLMLIRRSPVGLSLGRGAYVVMAFSPSRDSERTTLLATVAFERTFYELRQSRYARAYRDAMVGELERRLNENRPFDETDIHNAISDMAYVSAIGPAYSKVKRTENAFRDVPTSFRAMIVATIIFMLFLFAFYYTNFEGFDFKSFIDAFSISLFALMVEMGVALREELTEQMRRRMGLR
jgi:hypothetical protein